MPSTDPKRPDCRKCFICKGTTKPMFSWPTNKELALKWKENIGGDEEKLEEALKSWWFICTLHFVPECIGKGRLLNGSVPTLYLGL